MGQHATKQHSLSALIAIAVKAVSTATEAARGDTRTSCTEAVDYLEQSLKSVQMAAVWLKDLKAEEAADAKRVPVKNPAPKAPRPRVTHCEICEEIIHPDDVSICSGCDKPICPNCMAEETCKACESEG